MPNDSSVDVKAFVNGPAEAASTRALRALWYVAHGQWQIAHEEAQAGDDPDSAWVHALLHREEGDQSNAAYWYRQAGKPVFRGTIEAERDAMIAALLGSRA